MLKLQQSMATLLFWASIFTSAGTMAADATDWPYYGGDAGGQQFTPLTAINKTNVGALTEAFRWQTGDLGTQFKRKGHSFEATPLMWDGKLYVSTSGNWILAADAATGKTLWRFDAELDLESGYSESASRGVSLWHKAGPNNQSTCDHQVFMGTLDGRLIALDALTGKPCAQFGDSGTVDLNQGVLIGEQALSYGDYGVTSPPVVVGDRIIVGSAIGDNRAVSTERGIVRAFHAVTGKLLWHWDPIPRNATDPAFDSWQIGATEITGAANAWAPLSVDLERNLVFVPTSSASPDFYGGERPGNNHYTNSVVALNVATGAVVWHQQLVHHDVWDYDTPAQPTLTQITIDGSPVPAVLVATKTGMLYAFHRATGKPLFPIIERPVPASDVPGERLSPTQPFSSIPALANQSAITPDDAFGVLWFDKRGCQKIIRASRSEGLFTPPSLQGSIMNPGWAGGVNWGGVAVDSQRQIAVANVNQLPGLVKLIPRDEVAARKASGELDDWQVSRMDGTPYVMARRMFLSSLGLPCTKPPWGKLVAVDLATQTIAWEQPLGTIENLAPAPVPNFNWGTPNMGGPLLTASGLLIIGAAADHYLRGFDTQTGELLWQAELPAPAMATPMSYQLNGRQFIAVAVGGHSQMDTQRGDVVIAFALPIDH